MRVKTVTHILLKIEDYAAEDVERDMSETPPADRAEMMLARDLRASLSGGLQWAEIGAHAPTRSCLAGGRGRVSRYVGTDCSIHCKSLQAAY